MKTPEATSDRIADAAAEVLRNDAVQEAVLVFEGARILLTRSHRLNVVDGSEGDSLPEYPEVATKLRDDANSWLS